jgi:hypothetical protein
LSNKVAALTVAFNEPRLLPAIVRQFKEPYIKKNIYHMVLVSERPWHGSHPYDFKTCKAAKGADFILLDKWPNQAAQFNFGLSVLKEKGFDWAIICDADEFYTPVGIQVLLEDIELSTTGQLRAPYMEVYWKLPIFKIFNNQTDTPVVAIKTDQFFENKRTPSLSGYDTSSAVLFHMSYVRSNEEMRKKIDSFEHSNEFDRLNWYENVWKKWEIKNKFLHPVVPEQFSHAFYDPVPKEIMDNFYHGKIAPYIRAS